MIRFFQLSPLFTCFKRVMLLMAVLFAGQLTFNPVFADDNSAGARDRRVKDLKQPIESIQYGSKKPKGVVYVFTDMNCDFCRKLHHEFPKLAEQGIQVRVLAMPRQGIDSAGYKEWVSIWCSNDPNDSLDRAMEGERIAPQTCKNPIKQHYNLGRKWGVIGTPSVLFLDGTLKAGYFSAEKLAQEAIKRNGVPEQEQAAQAQTQETDKDKGKEKSKDKENDKSKDKGKDKEKDKGKIKDVQKDKEKLKDLEKDKGKPKDLEQDKNKAKDKEVVKDQEKEKGKDKDKDKAKANT